MRAREFERLSRRYLAPHFPAFKPRGDLLYEVPIGWLLRSFSFASSSYDPNVFFVDVFVQPLYQPADEVVPMFSRPLGGGTNYWEYSDEHAEAVMRSVLEYQRHEGIRFLELLATPADVAECGAVVSEAPDNIDVREACAYSLCVCGSVARAEAALRDLRERETASPDPDWPELSRERVERASTLIDALERGADAAREVLATWRDETLRALRLDADAKDPPDA